jgi:hypothetical protein
MFERKILATLRNQLKDRKISILVGPRQVGKTTLLKQLFSEISKEKKSLFLDIDIVSNYEKISSYETIINTLKANGYNENQKDLFYLFLDEFQKYPEITKIMKNLYDNNENIKIYASGSSSLTIKNQIQESLAGRKKVNLLLPLSFEEFLIFKNKKNLAENYKNLKNLKGESLEKSTKEYDDLLKEFMIFGSYPEVTLKNKKEEKIEVLNSIFDLYAKKDLIEYLKIEKILSVKKLIEYLSINNGQTIKYEEISQITGIKYNEIKKYIEILKETYLIYELRPYYTNKNKEIAKIPKIYFIDSGVRNYFIKNFNELKLRNDSGFLFEAFIISELLKKGETSLNFWHDKNDNEVDLIIGTDIKKALEIKYKNNLKSEDYKGITTFKKSYPKIKEHFIINLSTQKKEEIILLLPYSLDNIKFAGN